MMISWSAWKYKFCFCNLKNNLWTSLNALFQPWTFLQTNRIWYLYELYDKWSNIFSFEIFIWWKFWILIVKYLPNKEHPDIFIRKNAFDDIFMRPRFILIKFDECYQTHLSIFFICYHISVCSFLYICSVWVFCLQTKWLWCVTEIMSTSTIVM